MSEDGKVIPIRPNGPTVGDVLAAATEEVRHPPQIHKHCFVVLMDDARNVQLFGTWSPLVEQANMIQELHRYFLNDAVGNVKKE